MAQTRKKTNRNKKSSSKKKNSTITISKNTLVVFIAVIVGVFTAMLLFNTAMVSGGKIGEPAKVEKTIAKDSDRTNKTNKTNKTTQPKKQETKSSDSKPKTNKSDSSKTVVTNSSINTNSTISSDNSKSTNADKTTTNSQTVKAEVKPSAVTDNSTVIPPVISDFPSIPQAVIGAKIVIIYDDGGQNMAQLEKCLAVPFPVTVAVLPRLIHSKEASQRVRQSGNEVMLHQPMQALNLNVNPGQGAIKQGMTEDEIRSVLFQNITEVGPVVGMNNHEGSLITADAYQMSYVLKMCSDYGIFFLDSRTNVNTTVPAVASALGYSYFERNIFLDNQKTRQNIISEFVRGLSVANKKGVVIMIGHVWSADILPAVLTELYPLVKAKGYTFTTVTKSGALITP